MALMEYTGGLSMIFGYWSAGCSKEDACRLKCFEGGDAGGVTGARC